MMGRALRRKAWALNSRFELGPLAGSALGLVPTENVEPKPYQFINFYSIRLQSSGKSVH